MKKYIKRLLAFLFFITIGFIFCCTQISCTENSRARNWGGNITIKLDSDTKLVNATWRDNDLWVLTRQMRLDETPETYKFSEKSHFGVLQGEILFVETKTNYIAK
jgi:hypothetical protein